MKLLFQRHHFGQKGINIFLIKAQSPAKAGTCDLILIVKV